MKRIDIDGKCVCVVDAAEIPSKGAPGYEDTQNAEDIEEGAQDRGEERDGSVGENHCVSATGMRMVKASGGGTIA